MLWGDTAPGQNFQEQDNLIFYYILLKGQKTAEWDELIPHTILSSKTREISAKIRRFGLVLCFMTYQPSRVIYCQSHPCRRTVMLLYTHTWVGEKAVHTFLKDSYPKVNIIAWLDFKLVTIRRHSWYNGYHCRKWTGWSEFKLWMRLFVFHIVLITLGIKK